MIAYAGPAMVHRSRPWLALLYPLAAVTFITILLAAVLRTLRNSILLSGSTAIIGAVFGALLSYLVVTAPPTSSSAWAQSRSGNHCAKCGLGRNGGDWSSRK